MDSRYPNLLASRRMADKNEPKRPPVQPLPEAMEELKAASVPYWKMANEHLPIVETIWDEGGTILDALGHISPEYVRLQLPGCLHPAAETCDGCGDLWNLFEVELIAGKFQCPDCCAEGEA